MALRTFTVVKVLGKPISEALARVSPVKTVARSEPRSKDIAVVVTFLPAATRQRIRERERERKRGRVAFCRLAPGTCKSYAAGRSFARVRPRERATVARQDVRNIRKKKCERATFSLSCVFFFLLFLDISAQHMRPRMRKKSLAVWLLFSRGEIFKRLIYAVDSFSAILSLSLSIVSLYRAFVDSKFNFVIWNRRVGLTPDLGVELEMRQKIPTR